MKGSPMKPIKQGSPIDQTRRRWIDSRRWRGKTASERSEEGLEREVWLVFTAATLLLQLLRREAEWVRADLDWDGLLRLLAMRCTFKAFCCNYRIVLPKVLEINALTHHRRACFSMPSSPPTASLSLTHSLSHTHTRTHHWHAVLPSGSAKDHTSRLFHLCFFEQWGWTCFQISWQFSFCCDVTIFALCPFSLRNRLLFLINR